MENDGTYSGGRLENIKGASYNKTLTTAPEGEGKSIQPAFARGKCTPFGTAYHLSPASGGTIKHPVISRVGSGVEKSPGTMLLVASGKYVSRHTASLTSDRLKSDVSNLKNKTRNHVYKLNPR